MKKETQLKLRKIIQEEYQKLLKEGPIKKDKIFKIEIRHSNRIYYDEGTLEELIKHFSYTLEVGKSYENEKGNKKIDLKPKNINSLIKNIYNAKNNAAADGYSGFFYKLVED